MRLPWTCAGTDSPVASVATVSYASPVITPCTPSPRVQSPPPVGGFVLGCPVTDENENVEDFRLCRPPNARGECVVAGTEPVVVERIIRDSRSCTPCTCGDPIGGYCEATVTLYEDLRCSTPLGTPAVVDSVEPLCADVPSGSLSALTAELTLEIQGGCKPSDSRTIGIFETEPPSTLCCEE
jgi:hypothetical protein